MNNTFSNFIWVRSFIASTACFFALGLADSDAEQPLADPLAKPSVKQIRFADWEVGAFIHFGLNPFIDQEHGDGRQPPSKFNPTELDAEQWVRVAKSMGARYVVLTARHEGGFCLWPSKTTDYTIANSPYEDGKGDIVRDFVAACRKHDLAVGLYHTATFNAHEAVRDFAGYDEFMKTAKGNHPWSREWLAVGAAFRADPTLRERFDKIQIEQFRELLTNYGPIDFMWSDHWNAGDPDGLWRAITNLAEQLQPSMVFMGPDTWVPGNETGHVVYPMWNAINTQDGTVYTRPVSDFKSDNDYGLLEGGVTRGNPHGKFWRVRECTTNTAFHYGGWFWHPDDIKRTYPRATWEHLDLYYRTVGLGANTIINLPPDTRGLIPDDFVVAAKTFGDEIKKRFSKPIARLKQAKKGDVIELAWQKPQPINTVVMMENIANGQKIAKYSLEAFVEGQWQPLQPRNRLVAAPPYNSNPGFETVGHKKIDRVAPVTTNRIRFRCLKSIAEPAELRSFAVYHNEPIVRTFKSKYPWLSGVETTFDVAHGGIKRDINYRGETIVLSGKAYKKGLMVCPTKDIGKGVAEFDLTTGPQSKSTGMSAVIGIEDSTKDRGKVVFVVEGRIADTWKELFRSKKMDGASPAVPITVAFPKGMNTLRLKVTDGGNGVSSDHAIWADAKFLD